MACARFRVAIESLGSRLAATAGPHSALARVCSTRADAAEDVDDPRVQIWAEKHTSLARRKHLSTYRRPIQPGDFWSDPAQTSEELEALYEIRRLGSQRRWQDAVLLFNTLPNPTLQVRSAVVAACTKSWQLAQAQKLFHEMPVRTNQAYTSIIGLLGRMRRIHQAEQMFEDMKQECISPDTTTYTNLMLGYGMVGDVRTAIGMLRDIQARGVELTQIEYGCALVACGRAGAYQLAVDLVTEMDQAGVEVHIGHLTNLLVSCARGKDEVRAREAFAQIQQRGLRPDVVAYTSLLSYFGGLDALPKAEAIMAEMVSAYLAPHVFFYNELLRCARASKDPGRFNEILKEMETRGVQGNTATEEEISRLDQMERQIGYESKLECAGPLPLPAGWSETLDPSSGRPYYWLMSDPAGTTTWQRPA